MSAGQEAYILYQEALAHYDIGSDPWEDIEEEQQAVWERFADKVWGDE